MRGIRSFCESRSLCFFWRGELGRKLGGLTDLTPLMCVRVVCSLYCRPDVGSARADFPGGSASHLYSSTQFLLALPPTTRIFSGHDYPPSSPQSPTTPSSPRDKSCFSTVADQRLANLHVRDGVSSLEFEKMRKERDEGLGTPRLLHASLQVNLRGGRLPERDEEGRRWMRVPVEVRGEGGEDV